MSLILQIERDKALGKDIMHAAGIRTAGNVITNGIQITIMIWFSKGKPVGPPIAYFGNEHDVQLMWPYVIKEPRLYQSTIKKALPIIAKTNHSGHVGLRTIINVDDHKAYAIRWQTTETPAIVRTMSQILKPMFLEFKKWLEDGVDGDWMYDEFRYIYAGNVVDSIGSVNTKLISFRESGYEIPIDMKVNLV